MRDAAMSCDRRTSLVAAVAILSLTLSACGDRTDGSGTVRTDSAGVEVVTYRGPDIPLDWEFAVEFAIDGKGADEQWQLQLVPEYVAADASHNIYLLDRRSDQVVVYDSTGTLVRTMGGEGAGPGEMHTPVALSVSPGGTATVLDRSDNRLVRFGPDGTVLDEVGLTLPFAGGAIANRGESMIMASQESDADQPSYATQLLSLSARDTVSLVSHTRPAGKAIILFSCGLREYGVPPVFTPELRWTVTGSGVAAATTTGYAVTVYERDHLVRVLRRDIDPQPATFHAATEAVRAYMNTRFIGRFRYCDPEETVERRGYAELIPVIDKLAAGPGASLWVRRSAASGTPGPIDVFDADGSYRGTLPAYSPFPVAVLGDRIAAIEAGESYEDRLVVYNVSYQEANSDVTGSTELGAGSG
jgi:hypothetical protein